MHSVSLEEKLSRTSALWSEVSQLEQNILTGYQDNLRRRLLAIRSISELRPEVIQLIEKLGDLVDDSLLEHSEAIANIPLFHPAFEETQQALEGAESEELFFQLQLNTFREKLKVYYDMPYRGEIRAINELVRVYEQRHKISEELAGLENIPRLYDTLKADQTDQINQKVVSSGLGDQMERLNDVAGVFEDILENEGSAEEEFTVDLEHLVQFLTRLKSALQDSVQEQKASLSLKSLIEELDEIDDATGELSEMDVFDDLFEDQESMDDIFANFFAPEEEDWMEVADPKFPKGSVVAIHTKHWLQANIEDVFEPNKEFPAPPSPHAHVINALTDGQEVFYELLLDATTLKSLPVEFIKYMCDDVEESFAFHLLPENDLSAASARSTEEEAILTYKELFNRYFWGDIDSDPEARMIYDVLMVNPEEGDIHNWYQFFSKTLDFPFKARVEGVLHWDLPENSQVEVLALGNISESDDADEYGLQVFIKQGANTQYYPLMDLLPLDEKTSTGEAIMAYRWWSDLFV